MRCPVNAYKKTMKKERLTDHILLEHDETQIHVQLDSPFNVASSAVLNGGIIQADHILNLRVPGKKDGTETGWKHPGEYISNYCRAKNWKGNTVGMMTAASMDSFRMTRSYQQGVDIIVLVTAGISNARRAGDTAEHRQMGTPATSPGTINTIVITSAKMTHTAMIEAIATATEAKVAALQNLGVKSRISDSLATGTGTDSIAIASGSGPTQIHYCGKHVLFGEILARLIIQGLHNSLNLHATVSNKTHTVV
jgi:adenosylcobinamide hydrolase